MANALSISNKIFSIKGKMYIADEFGAHLYEANGEYSFNPSWTIKNNTNDIGSIKFKVWSWSPTWIVSSVLGDFMIQRKRFSWTQRYRVIGGPYNEALILGHIWDHKFEIIHNDSSIASAASKFISMRDTHTIQVHEPSQSLEVFTVIVMVTLLIDRKRVKNNSDNDSDFMDDR